MKTKKAKHLEQKETNASVSPTTRTITARLKQTINQAGNISDWLPWVYVVILPVIMGTVLVCLENETLFRIQELNLFLPTRLFYEGFAAYPGGTLLWMACFFTQFFFYPALGVTILTIMWIGIFALSKKLFKIPVMLFPLMGLLPACLLASIVQMGYFIFYIKLQGYFFAATIGILLALCALLVYKQTVQNRFCKWTWPLLWMAAGYPLFGAYALLGSLYIILYEWKNGSEGSWKKSAFTVVNLILMTGIPLIAHQFYSQTSISEIYMAALPGFDVAGRTYTNFRIPFYIAFALPIILITLHNARFNGKKWQTITVHLIILTGTVLFVKHFWFHDENFSKELRMNRAIEEEDWEKVIRISLEGSAEPTRQIVMFRDLALFHLGRSGNEMFHYRQGSALPNAPFSIRLVQTGGKTLYYNYGQANYCYRWCMEDGVTFGWKTEYLKFMARTALINGEPKLATKYLNMLKQTLFHKKWAEKYAFYAAHPEKIDEDPSLKFIRSLRPKTNKLASDQSVIELFLLRQFAYNDSDDPIFQEQALIAALQMKEIDLFWDRFAHYAALNPHIEMPIHYQEAAYLYGHLENKVDISHMPFDQEVKDTYERFMAFSQQCAGMTEEEMAVAFYPQFGHTFYYFYFLVRGLHTY